MKIKTFKHEDKTYAELKDGKPIYVDDAGKETTYDPVSMHTTISRLNKESQTHREAKEALEKEAKKFEGLDPVASKKALEIVKNLDDKKLVDAGEVARIKEEVTNTFQKKLDKSEAANEKLRTQYSTERINSAFASSKYIKEKLAVPADMAQATFGKHFVFKEGVMTPVDAQGSTIYSSSNPGDIASFDEAMERVVESYTHRDSILKGAGHVGSGALPGDDGTGKRTVTRDQFSKMTPLEQQKIAKSEDVKVID